MDRCLFLDERSCRSISLKTRVRYFFGNTLALGDIVSISDSCICVETKYCFPLHSEIKLLIPLEKKVLHIPVRVSHYLHPEPDQDVMCVQVLQFSAEYVEFLNGLERRRSKRVPVDMKGKLVVEDMVQPVVMQNMSEQGLHLSYTPLQQTGDIAAKPDVEIRLLTPSGNTLNLQCVSKWSFAEVPESAARRVGMEIMSPPGQYLEFLYSLK